MTGFDLTLYLVLDPRLCAGIGMVETARRAVAGGATMVQLRDKGADTAALVETGRALKRALAGTGVSLIVNDDVEAAMEIGADGVHVGQSDRAARDVRERLGRERILGLSIDREDALRGIDPQVVDYAGVGPVFATATKPDHSPPIGFTGLARFVSSCPVPTVAIGGLRAKHAAEALATGVGGLAVVSAICGQPDPGAAAAVIRTAIDHARAPVQS